MKKNKVEYCFGIIPLKKDQQDWEVLLVKHKQGNYWSFHKGHIESGEHPIRVAERELEEETGLHVGQYLPIRPVIEEYIFTQQEQIIHKTATYFLAEIYAYDEIKLKKDEIEKAIWIPLHKAQAQITFKTSQQVCSEVIQLLEIL